jgi:hypothetical protein
MTAPPAIMGVALGYQETLEPNPSREGKQNGHPSASCHPPNRAGRSRNGDGGGGRVRDGWSGARSTKRSALFVLTYPSAPILFLRICHSGRLSAKLELPDPLGRTILQTPKSDKALRPAWSRFVKVLTLCARRSRATTACGAAVPAGGSNASPGRTRLR